MHGNQKAGSVLVPSEQKTKLEGLAQYCPLFHCMPVTRELKEKERRPVQPQGAQRRPPRTPKKK